MENYNLLENEAIILKNERAYHPIGRKIGNPGELVLTNLNIFYSKKGIFGGTKEILKFPLSEIKIIDGNPQVNLGKNANSQYQMEIYFRNSQECFYFVAYGKKELIKWIDKISELLTGKQANIDDRERNYVPGVSEFAGALKNTIGTMKDAFGIKEKEPEKVTIRCMSCGAPLTGNKGSVIKCRFCGIEQTLK